MIIYIYINNIYIYKYVLHILRYCINTFYNNYYKQDTAKQ